MQQDRIESLITHLSGYPASVWTDSGISTLDLDCTLCGCYTYLHFVERHNVTRAYGRAWIREQRCGSTVLNCRLSATS